MTTTVRKLDQSALKTGQALTILLLIIGFVLDSWVPVAFVGIAQLLAALESPFAPFRLVYQRILKPAGLVKPRIEPDNPEPHRFSMFIGTIFNGLATIALLTGASLVGWILVAIVVALANLNFWLNFCVGCWVYYQLNRLGVPGFSASQLQEQHK
jgi:hypothetical protein